MRLFAAYPGRQVGEANIAAATETLIGWPYEIGNEAVERLASSVTNPPSKAELLLTLRGVKKDSEQRALPEAKRCPHNRRLSERCDECFKLFKSKFDEIRAGWKDDAKHDPDAVAVEALANLNALPVSLRNSCKGSGKWSVERDGKHSCPDCGMELE